MVKNKSTRETVLLIVGITLFFIFCMVLERYVVCGTNSAASPPMQTIESDAGTQDDASLDVIVNTPVTDAILDTGREDVVLGSTTTAFQSYGRLYSNRARNIRLATRILNGTVVQPSETFSFNQIVGPRDREHGFREAPTIINGEMSESYGGGVCQIASTLFSSVLYSGLTILETRPHTHYMHYIGPGFDSTVFYDYVDLRFRNDFNFPITILSETNSSNELTIRILGREIVYNVLVEVQTLLRRRITEQRILNENLEPGTQRITDFGTSRMRVRRTITYTPVNPNTTWQSFTIINNINYAPTPRLVEFH